MYGLMQDVVTAKEQQVKVLLDVAKENGIEITLELYKHIVDRVYVSGGPLDRLLCSALGGMRDSAGTETDIHPPDMG